jgi:hypothetical protein
MGRGKDVHVTKKDGHWQVKKTGNEKASSTHRTQADAWQAGKEAAKQEKSEGHLHGENGRIRERESYGNDPYPPRDRK